MPEIRSRAIEILDKAISKIKDVHYENPYHFLSEDDHKCFLYSQLYTMIDPEVCLHSEVSFYDKHDKLAFRPDLSIMLKKEIKYTPHKFNWEVPDDGVIAFVEIKYIRNKSQRNIEEIEKDIQKLKQLLILNPKAKVYLLCCYVSD